MSAAAKPVFTPGMHYVEFDSAVIGASIRIGFGVEDDDAHHYQCGVFYAAVEITEVWLGAVDLSQNLLDSTVKVIEYEVYAEFRRRADIAHGVRLANFNPPAQFVCSDAGMEFA